MKTNRDDSFRRFASFATLICLGLLGLGSHAARAAELRWQPSTSPTVVGYRAHIGSASGFFAAAQVERTVDIGSDFAVNAGVASRPLEDIISGPAWVVLTAYDAEGLESPPSNQLFRDLPTPCSSHADCVDGDACNGEERCDAGFCSTAAPLQCDFFDACSVGSCDPASGCAVVAVPDGSVCSDNDPFTSSDRCEAGTCTGDVIDFSSPDGVYQSFDEVAIGQDPPGWLDTGVNNSLTEADLFEVTEVSGDRVFGTTSVATNIHSHLLPPGDDTWSDYELRGRMRISNATAGIGVTLYSDFPNSDAYYRLRRYNSGSFHFSHHGGASGACVGDMDTGVTPAANTWYDFRFIAFSDGDATRVQAKVWPHATSEPAAWQADCLDSTPTRRRGGAPGLWSMAMGEKYWDDLAVVPLQPADELPPIEPDCRVDDDCGDANACTGIERCVEGICVDGTALACESSEICGVARCVASVGCVVDPVVDGTPCGGGDACNAVDTCEGGACTAGAALVCPDPGMCQVGRCDPASGCESTPVPDGSECDDGNSDTLQDSCNAGACMGTLPPEEPPADDPPTTDGLLFDLDNLNPGADPPGWFDTGASNSLAEADLFEVMELSDGNSVFGTRSTLTNIHSHWLSEDGEPGSENLSGYELNGRMRMSHSRSGIGVTLYSDYPNSDAYYRLRRYNGRSFHLSPHTGDPNACIGITDTGVKPIAHAWYSFRFRAVEDGDGTRVQAKVWPMTGDEPEAWQADCLDTSADRRVDGAPGVWSMGPGEKYWDDLAVTSVHATDDSLPGAPECESNEDCNDEDLCSGFESCIEGSCVDGLPLECPDPGSCGVARCYAFLGCVVEPQPDGTVCGEGDACSNADLCSGGVCSAGAARSCPDMGDCRVGRCDPVRGCESTALPDGSYCDDGNFVTENDVCRSGFCAGTLPPVPPEPDDEPTPDRSPIGETGQIFFDFEDVAPGESPFGWLDTGDKNSLEMGDDFWVFEHGEGNHVFGTTSRATNIHSHLVAMNSADWFDYEYRGRMLAEKAASGIGVTLYSDYPSSDSYYRLRHYAGHPFQLAHHSDNEQVCVGSTMTSVVPDANTWYAFRLQAFDDQQSTRLRAKVWVADEPEPEVWEVDCLMQADGAYFGGSPGVWAMGRRGKFWDDLEMIELDGSQLP